MKRIKTKQERLDYWETRCLLGERLRDLQLLELTETVNVQRRMAQDNYDNFITNNIIVTEYCLGFFFTPDMKRVVLIKKNHPEWQKGKLNGVGGKLLIEELPGNGMTREFREETGVYTFREHWVHVMTIEEENWELTIYGGIYHGKDELKLQITESEIPSLYDVEDLTNTKAKDALPHFVDNALEYLWESHQAVKNKFSNIIKR